MISESQEMTPSCATSSVSTSIARFRRNCKSARTRSRAGKLDAESGTCTGIDGREAFCLSDQRSRAIDCGYFVISGRAPTNKATVNLLPIFGFVFQSQVG